MMDPKYHYLERKNWYNNTIADLKPISKPSEWDNKPCACHPTHLLHSKKDSIVVYDGGVWALQCAISMRTMQLMDTIEDYDDYIKHLEELNIWHEQQYEQLLFIAKEISQYRAHRPSCRLTEFAEYGRVTECTCGLNHLDPNALIMPKEPYR